MDSPLFEQNLLLEGNDPTTEIFLNEDLIDPFLNPSNIKSRIQIED